MEVLDKPAALAVAQELTEQKLQHQVMDLTARSPNPAALLQIAIERNADLDQLQKLMDLQERWDRNEARKAYTDDMAQAKRTPPVIKKDRDVSYESTKGVTSYSHASLGNVVQKVVAWLAEHGFSHAWGARHVDGNKVAVTCTVTHRLGHAESVTLESPHDPSGGKNGIQALGSSITYLQRYTLLAITGLATEDQDDDGDGAEPRGVSAVASETADSIAASIYERLLSDLKNCTTDEKALDLWKSGSKSLHATGCTKLYEDFKEAVADHRLSLKGGKPA